MGRFRLLVVCVLALVVVTCLAGTALAFNERDPYVDPPRGWDGNHGSECQRCHTYVYSTWVCTECHDKGEGKGTGPHTGYTTSTSKCKVCHTLHDAPTDFKLLPGETIKATCESCHDGTGGRGVYGAIAARGLAVGARHRIDATNIVPGGDPVGGGTAVMSFDGEGGQLTCTDCHTPHSSSTVAEFVGDRQRTYNYWKHHVERSHKLLRQRPGGSATAVAQYGSDWCLACHGGRSSGGVVHNHPVDAFDTQATPFNYNNVAVLASDDPTSLTVMSGLGGWDRPAYTGMHGNEVSPDGYAHNRGFLMPVPRTAQQAGHFPICQQCHEDTRSVGTLSADGTTGDAAALTITAPDGTVSTDNPRFQNFPHETVNSRMLVETGDNLCTNCHPAAVLP